MSATCIVTSETLHLLRHIYTTNQPGTIEIAHEWATFFEEYSKQHNRTIFSVAEMSWLNTLRKAFAQASYTLPSAAEDLIYYKTGLDLPFNFNLTHWVAGMSAAELRQIITPWLRQMPRSSWANFVLGNHDGSRSDTFLGLSLCIAFL